MSNPDIKIKSFRLCEGKTSVLQIGILLLVALFFIGLVALGGWGVNREIDIFSDKLKRDSVKTFSGAVSVSGKNVEIPDKFPKNLPIVESNLVEAYERNTETKDIDTIFESKKTAKENFDYYLNYFKKNNWQIDEAREINENKPGKILASKDGFVITLVFEPKENNASKITISSTTINTKQLENIDIKGLRL